MMTPSDEWLAMAITFAQTTIISGEISVKNIEYWMQLVCKAFDMSFNELSNAVCEYKERKGL
jgi:hypothetical protein